MKYSQTALQTWLPLFDVVAVVMVELLETDAVLLLVWFVVPPLIGADADIPIGLGNTIPGGVMWMGDNCG